MVLQVTDLITALKNNQGNLKVETADVSNPLPPASLQSFLKRDLTIPGLIISNHKNKFTNQFYNSEWDTYQSISSSILSKQLAEIARTVSATIYELATGDKLPGDIQANVTLVSYLIYNLHLKMFEFILLYSWKVHLSATL